MGFRHALPLTLAVFGIVYAKPLPVPDVAAADASTLTTISAYLVTTEVVYTSFKTMTIVYTNSDGKVTSKCIIFPGAIKL